MLLIPSSLPPPRINCATWWNDSPAAKYCATNWNYLVFLTMMEYWLTSPASAAYFEEYRVSTKLAIIRAWVTPYMYYGWNIMSPMMIPTISLLISVHKVTMRVPANTCNIACYTELLPIYKNDFFALASRSKYSVHLAICIHLLYEE